MSEMDVVNIPDICSELVDVVGLLQFAIDEALQCTFEDVHSADTTGMTNRESRFVALLSMTQGKVASAINSLDQHH